ncbi:ribosome silencing factor [Methylophilaceae bacterium]|nr:ribosome silencing factor [Methylophilaceae bacterium]
MISGTKLNQFIINSLEDIKAFDITVIDVRKKTSIADYMIIASANSNRQTKALARHLKDTLKEINKSVANIEGEVDGEWVLVDLNDVLVHIMLPTTRAYFNLEELWQS